jgi:hypothetical protein
VTSLPASPGWRRLAATLDPLLAYFNITVLRAVYNFTGLSAEDFTRNWQYVWVRGLRNDTVFNATRLIFLSPTAFAASAGARLRAEAYMFGYGRDVYTVAVRVGNFTAVGTVRSFTPYFIQLGDNWKLFRNMISWLVEERPIAPPPPKPHTAQPPTPPIYPETPPPTYP